VQKGGKITHLLHLSRDLVSRSTITQIASFPLFPLGSPNTKSIVIISHFHSGIGNGCNQGCQFCFGRYFVFSIGMEWNVSECFGVPFRGCTVHTHTHTHTHTHIYIYSSKQKAEFSTWRCYT